MSARASDTFQITLAPAATDSTTVVETIIDGVINAIANGDLRPGQRVSDARLAEQLGISRTPVREALQRLREIGIIEASASRFTRVAVLTPKQTADALIVWIALFSALIDEVIPVAPVDLYESMRSQHENFLAGLERHDPRSTVAANVAFFHSPTPYSDNPTLKYSLTASVQLVRLGGLRIAGEVDFARIVTAQEFMLEAVRTRSTDLAHQALHILRGVRVPDS